MRKVFLAIPVQGDRLPKEDYESLVDILNRLGLRLSNPEVLTPPLPDEINRYSPQDIYTKDRLLLATSDLLVAEISRPSLGVGYEIAMAEHFGLPILCLYRRNYEQNVSLMIKGSPYHQQRSVAFQTLEELEVVVSEALREFGYSAAGGRLSGNSVAQRTAIDRHFDELAAVHDMSTEWRREERMLSWFQNVLSGSKRCLELGTGTGLVGESLRKGGIFVVGIDRSLRMLQHARARLNMVVCADALAVPLSDAMFDAVAVRQLFHYVDDRSCLQEISRVTAPNGLLACAHLAAPDEELALWWRKVKRVVQPLRRRFYTSQELDSLVSEAGFVIERLDTMELARWDTWERFLANCEGRAQAKSHVRELLEQTPKSIAHRIKLQISDSGISYTQNWLLLLSRCRKIANTRRGDNVHSHA